MRGHPSTPQSRKTAARKSRQLAAITDALIASRKPQAASLGPLGSINDPLDIFAIMSATQAIRRL